MIFNLVIILGDQRKIFNINKNRYYTIYNILILGNMSYNNII